MRGVNLTTQLLEGQADSEQATEEKWVKEKSEKTIDLCVIKGKGIKRVEQ